MREIARAIIESDFTGWHGGSVFKLSNGQVWQQREYRHAYHYAYRPEARIVEDGGTYLLQVATMADSVTVTQISIVEEGVIVSDFTGFSDEARFEFQSGHTWVPAEYRYSYHYAHRPQAMVVDGICGLELIVDGMSYSLRVRRA